MSIYNTGSSGGGGGGGSSSSSSGGGGGNGGGKPAPQADTVDRVIETRVTGFGVHLAILCSALLY